MYTMKRARRLLRNVVILLVAICFVGTIASTGCKKETPTAPPPEGDLTPPTAQILYPLDGATVAGTVTVRVDAADNVGVTKVELLVNGAIHDTRHRQPYEFEWDTSPHADDGQHSLLAKAYDAAGNVGNSPLVRVTVPRQTYSGRVLDRQSRGLAGGTVTLGTLDTVTDRDGSFVFQGVLPGEYALRVQVPDFVLYDRLVEVPVGSAHINVTLDAQVLPQATGLQLDERPGGVRLRWTALESQALLGYAVYAGWSYGHQFEGSYLGGDCRFRPHYSSWERISSEVITSTELIWGCEEFNAHYRFYVAPVNSDGAETPYSQSNTVVRFLDKDYRYNELTWFILQDDPLPLSIPDDGREVSWGLVFRATGWRPCFNFAFTAQLSINNGASWITIGRSGCFRVSCNCLDCCSGHVFNVSLNNYRGSTVLLRTRTEGTCGDDPPYMIYNTIREWIY